MKFGKVENPGEIDFSLPPDHPNNVTIWGGKPTDNFNVYVGCAKWNRADLKNFYPRGTKDELAYYSTQLNSIELNATFYRIFPKTVYSGWKDKTPDNFRFFPKVFQNISHYKRLQNCDELVEQYTDATVMLEEKLGCCFLQLHDNYSPKHIDSVEGFLSNWPKALPLAVEVRHQEWYSTEAQEKLCEILQDHNLAHILVDTAGRRDLVHMRFTNKTAFVRFVGANHSSDYTRLEEWVNRIEQWKNQGLENLYFFIHQNVEKESPLLATGFIQALNKRLNLNLPYPGKDNEQGTLGL